MAAKIRPPIVRSVQTPEALAALRKWVAAYEQITRDRGEAHFKAGHITTPPTAKADHFVEAVVRDDENYRVTLFLTRGLWTSVCSCSRRTHCRHAVATAYAWLAVAEEPAAPDRFRR